MPATRGSNPDRMVALTTASTQLPRLGLVALSMASANPGLTNIETLRFYG